MSHIDTIAPLKTHHPLDLINDQFSGFFLCQSGTLPEVKFCHLDKVIGVNGFTFSKKIVLLGVNNYRILHEIGFSH